MAELLFRTCWCRLSVGNPTNAAITAHASVPTDENSAHNRFKNPIVLGLVETDGSGSAGNESTQHPSSLNPSGRNKLLSAGVSKNWQDWLCNPVVFHWRSLLERQQAGVIARVRLNSFHVPCRPSQEGPDSPSYPNHGDAYNQKCFPSLAHLLP